MKLLSYDYDLMKKYIIYSDENKIHLIHYVYRIFLGTGSTELIQYELGVVKHTTEIKSIILFNKKEPLQAIAKFYKILLLGV